MNKKNKISEILKKINIIDILILIFILIILFFCITKLKSNKIINHISNNTYIMKFYTEEVKDFVAKNIYIGDNVLDDIKNVNLGKVIDFKVYDSIDFNPNYEGKLIPSSKEGYNSVEITTELKAQEFENGILINGNKYGIGHSLTIRVGKTVIFLKISSIENKENIK